MNISIFDNEKFDKLLKIADDYIKRGNINVVIINGQKLVCFTDGTIIRILQNGNQKLVENVVNHNMGYNKVGCNGKMILRHRIIAFAFLGLNINNTSAIIDHINHNKIENNINNLRVVSQQQNMFNRTMAKGYYWNKRANKYQARIQLNKKIIMGNFQIH